jgi:protein required for attachment to host cells
MAAHLRINDTYIVVANRSQARIFKYMGLKSGLELLEKFNHPTSRLHNRDLVSDRPGRSSDRSRVARHALSSEVDPHDEQAVEFAREIAEKLRVARGRNEYSRLMLVAEAGFLGKLKQALDAGTMGCLVATLDRDFHQKSSSELSRHLDQYLVVG